MMQNQNTIFPHNKAYTMIELLISVIILSVVATIAIVRYQNAVEGVKAKRIKEILFEVIASQKRYSVEHGDAWADNLGALNALDYKRGNDTFVGDIARANIGSSKIGFAVWRYENAGEYAVAMFSTGSALMGEGSYVIYTDFENKSSNVIVRCSDGSQHVGICAKLGY